MFFAMRDVHTLVGNFLDNAWPTSGPPQIRVVEAGEIAAFLFANAPAFKATAEKFGMVWRSAAIAEVDVLLEGIADSGVYDFKITLSSEGTVEFWRRYSYAITAFEMERQAKTGLAVPVPVDAPDNLQGMAILLYAVGGIGRGYPHSLFPRR